MARKQFSRGRGRLGSERQTSWFPIDITSTTVSSLGSILNSLTAAEQAKRPFTVVRTHLHYEMTSDQTAASENQIAGLGLAVVSDQASGIGNTAVPTPLADLGSDLWFVHELMFGDFLFGDATGFIDPSGVRGRIDSKAMRKVNDDEDIVVVAEADTILGFGLILRVGGRILVKEH